MDDEADDGVDSESSDGSPTPEESPDTEKQTPPEESNDDDTNPEQSNDDATAGSHVRGNVSFVGGILGGGLAYGIGLVTTAILFVVTQPTTDEFADQVTAANVDQATLLIRAVGAALQSPSESIAFYTWPFYNAHGVSISLGDSEAVNLLFLLDLDFGVNFLYFLLIPAILLFVFGGLIALLKRADGFIGGILSGSSVMMGYLPLVVAGAFFFKVSGYGVTAQPQLLPAIILAGILFPLVCGGLAGLVKILFINVIIGGIRAHL